MLLSPRPAGWYTSFLVGCFRFWIFTRWVHVACLLSSEFNWFLKIFMKILCEGDVKPTHSERERKNLSFLLDYFADDVRYDSAKPLLYLVQNPVHGGCSTREKAQLLLNLLRKTCIGILGRGESKLTKLSKILVYLISASFRKFLLASELPITDPRTRAPCVIYTFVPANSVDAWRSPRGLIINWHFGGLTRYPYLGPSWVSLSKSALIWVHGVPWY